MCGCISSTLAGCLELLIPFFWKLSIIVPIPEGRVKGVCDTNGFRGTSLTSLVGQIMCMVLNNRLAGFWKLN